MTSYETMIIIDSMISDQEIQNEIKTIKDKVEANGEIIKVDPWGKRKMAYEINKKSHGFYVVFYYKAEATVIAAMEKDFRINENIIRWMSLKDHPLPQEYVSNASEKAEAAPAAPAEEAPVKEEENA